MYYTKSARFYDALYAVLGKDYAEEARYVHTIVQRHKRSAGNTLLDVGCGTGGHIQFLQQYYTVVGLDLDPEMLAIARQNHSGVPFYQADMADFALDRRFDAIVCLFSAIGYVKTVPRLHQALHTMSSHCYPGGVIVVEPWLTPVAYQPGHVHALFVDQPEFKIARMNVSAVEDNLSVLDFNYLVATLAGVEHFTERHELGLFSHEEYLAAFRAAGLEVAFLTDGLMGRGLYIGTKPSA